MTNETAFLIIHINIATGTAKGMIKSRQNSNGFSLRLVAIITELKPNIEQQTTEAKA